MTSHWYDTAEEVDLENQDALIEKSIIFAQVINDRRKPANFNY